jgi:hypothetical protein
MVNTFRKKQVYHNNILFKNKNKNILSNRIKEENYQVIDLDPNKPIMFEYDPKEKKYAIKNAANSHYNNNSIRLIVSM